MHRPLGAALYESKGRSSGRVFYPRGIGENKCEPRIKFSAMSERQSLERVEILCVDHDVIGLLAAAPDRSCTDEPWINVVAKLGDYGEVLDWNPSLFRLARIE